MVMTVALVVGGAIGALLAARVEMTSMPQLVAILHSFVGAAAVLVGIATALDHEVVFAGIERRIHDTEIFLGIFVGAITFTGSVVAFGKLQGLIGSKPLLLPGRHVLNLVMLLACVYLGYTFVTYGDYFPVLWPLLVVTGDRLADGHSPRDGHRRRRHAGGGLDAQQLLGLGGGGGRASCSRTIC